MPSSGENTWLHYAFRALIIVTVLNIAFVSFLIHISAHRADLCECFITSFIYNGAPLRLTFILSCMLIIWPSGYKEDNYPAQLPLELSSVGLAMKSQDEPYFGLHADAEWRSQFPPSGGFTDLGPNNRTFMVSMVHQLHCLDFLRVGYVTNRTDLEGHVQHCLQYMRQVVLCNADTTLESANSVYVDGKWIYVGDMGGSVHRCKDWTMLRRYLEENPAHLPGSA